MRVFAATLATETNTFSPLPTGWASFEEGELFRRGAAPEEATLFTAPLWAARLRAAREGGTVVPGLCASAQPGGPTTRKTYEALRDELLADLTAALPVDMVVLGLHGAMVADGYDDCEGDLLERVRGIVGPGVPVGAELDPHCHLSDRMVSHATVLVCYKEYPHTDFRERGLELVDLCAAAAAGRIRPVISVYDCRMIGIFHTSREPIRSFIDHLKALEGHDHVLSISVIHGFPWGDVADFGTKIMVITDGEARWGMTLAEILGRELIALREAAMPRYLSAEAAVDAASKARSGPVVVADVSDNPGGGAPGDATFLLRILLERRIVHAALGPFYDPMAVRLCFEAGEGARMPLRIGGKTSPMSGDPLDLDVEILSLRRDARQSFGSSRVEMGDAARIRAEGIEIILTSRRVQAMGQDLFTSLGTNLLAQRLIVVKSSQHFHAAFSPIAHQVIYAAPPGAIMPDFQKIPYRNIPRPLWPIDR
ncbi:M81 family metallopeptidase [Microvirga pudoricolor]|uniref:M81 family metallopeptidase n=1 Tax=Microvirga pudoricolor TaxID=2778729 RepID=UPI00194FEB27|nr:M81 family metallopeptidase [Microvirga pudoricolor]MBM6593630.1 M81 family metallopeptidase [Microvirga pudoricolor]